MKLKSLFIYIVCVILGVVVIDVVFRLVFTPIFENPPINTKAGATYKFVSYNKPANVIVLGASRANHHYRSKQMEDSLGVSVYNYGWDGRCTLYQYLCLLKGVENGDLKTVILDISDAQLSREWVDDRVSDLYPYYWKDDTVKAMVDKISGKDMRILMLSALIQYNSQYLNFLAPVANTNGYVPLPYTGKPVSFMKEVDSSILNKDSYYSSMAVKYFKQIVKICRDLDIELYVCLSPALSVSKNSESYIETLCRNNDVTCWNKTHYIDDPLLFSDLSHLNDKGAELFSNEIIRLIKSNK